MARTQPASGTQEPGIGLERTEFPGVSWGAGPGAGLALHPEPERQRKGNAAYPLRRRFCVSAGRPGRRGQPRTALNFCSYGFSLE